jgi:hypothetical protein
VDTPFNIDDDYNIIFGIATCFDSVAPDSPQLVWLDPGRHIFRILEYHITTKKDQI